MLNQVVVSPVIGSGSASTSPLSAPLYAGAFVDLPYSPALLLDASFSAVITDDAEFRVACGWGFEAYFEEMYEVNEARTGSVFVERSYTRAEAIAFVLENARSHEAPFMAPSVAWDAGFVLGWLSAHALVDRPAALVALELLRVLIEPSSSVVAKR